MPRCKHVVFCSLFLFLGSVFVKASNPWPLAIQALEEKDYLLADSLFAEIITEFPSRPEAHLYRAQSRYWLKDYEQALYHLSLANPPSQQMGRAEMLRAYCHYNMGEVDKARFIMEDIVLHYEDLRDSARAFLVSYHRAEENFSQAHTLLSSRLEDKPRAYIFAERALVALELGNVQDAIDDFSSAIALDSQQVDYYWRRAILYGEGGEYDQAITDYNKAITLDKDNDVLWRNRAIEALSAKRHKKALYDLEKLVKRYPNDLELLKALFYCYYALKHYEQASNVYDKIEQIDPNNALLTQYDRNELLSSTFFQRFINVLQRSYQVLRAEWMIWIPLVFILTLIAYGIKMRRRKHQAF